jgi:hypothetical protein
VIDLIIALAVFNCFLTTICVKKKSCSKVNLLLIHINIFLHLVSIKGRLREKEKDDYFAAYDGAGYCPQG